MSANTTTNHLLCTKLRMFAIEIFQRNLLYFFIGGSRATNNYRTDSDLDFFVLLKKPNRKKEYQFALKFKELCDNHKLPISHIGEIFDQKTLDNLFSNAQFLFSSDFFSSPCYINDCRQSVMRKANIVCGFLAHTKKYTHGRKKYIIKYLNFAKMVKTVEKQIVKTVPNISHGSSFEKLVDSVVGISLYKYFRIIKSYRKFCNIPGHNNLVISTARPL